MTQHVQLADIDAAKIAQVLRTMLHLATERERQAADRAAEVVVSLLSAARAGVGQEALRDAFDEGWNCGAAEQSEWGTGNMPSDYEVVRRDKVWRASDTIAAALATQPSPPVADDVVQAETYRDMHEIATKELGYPSILEALEAAPHASTPPAADAAMVERPAAPATDEGEEKP